MKKSTSKKTLSFVHVYAVAVAMILGLAIVWKFDLVQLSAKAGPLNMKMEGKTTPKEVVPTTAPYATSPVIEPSVVQRSQPIEPATAVTHGNQSPVISGSSAVVIHYGAPDAH